MTKHNATVLLFVFATLLMCQGARAADSTVPEPFVGFDDSSQLAINYDDLTSLLRAVVVDVGRSSRTVTEVPPDITGTRMKAKVKRFTANEGNRFYYETFKDNDAAQQYVLGIRKSLEQLPSEIPLASFSRDEQLAYWLNLYNVTVLNEVIAVYPRRTLRKLFRGRSSIFSKKLLNVAGIPLSLDDIQYTILSQNYDNDPLIIYGLYQGIVGAPNIRTSAYTGDDVYRALEENADVFINSNRGTLGREDDFFQVSSFYDRNRQYFPDFDADLSEHLLTFLDGKERERLEGVGKIKPDIDDWTVTDMGGTVPVVGRSLAHNNAALLDSYKSNRRNIDGSIRLATLKIEREKKDPREDEVELEDLERFPVEGADVEEVSTEDSGTTE